ncbi:hypothetical protein ABK040_002182 [Willaertia magna]
MTKKKSGTSSSSATTTTSSNTNTASTNTTTTSTTTTLENKPSSFISFTDDFLEILGVKNVPKNELFNTLLKNFEETEDRSDKETLFLCICSVLSEEKNETTLNKNYENLISKIDKTEGEPKEVFKQYITLLNMIANPSLKAKVFTTVLQKMSSNDEYLHNINLVSFIENIEKVLDEWNITKNTDKQSIYLELGKVAEKLERNLEAFDLYMKYLKVGGDANEKKRLVKLFINNPLDKSLEELKEYDNDFFGSIISYIESENDQVPDSLIQKIKGVESNEQIVSRLLGDIRILKFLVNSATKLIASGSKGFVELKYNEIENLTNGLDVEMFVCELIGRNLLECKLNQLDQTIRIESVKCPAALMKHDWKGLEGIVAQWSTKLGAFLKSLNTPTNPQQFKTDLTKQ